MDRSFFEDFANRNVQFFDFFLPKMLEKLLENLKKFSLIDVGCGDGTFIYAMYHKGLLKNSKKIVGVDMSKNRINRLKSNLPFVKGIVADAQNLRPIKNSSFDIAICSQIIEHVIDDRKMLKEMHRVLKSGGHLYISTVVKKGYGFWIYWKGGFRLDPTHVKEYKNPEEFLNLLKKSGFRIIGYGVNTISYSILDLVVRSLIWFNVIKASPDFYLRHRILQDLRNRVKFSVIGYKTLEVVAVKEEGKLEGNLSKNALKMRDELSGRLRRSFELLAIDESDKILDVGCKSGWLERIASERCKEIIGVDIDKDMILDDKKKIKNAKFFLADVTRRLPFSSKYFDKVCFLETIEHLPKGTEENALREIRRVLKDDGILILSTPNNNLLCKLTDPAHWVIGHRHYNFDFIKDILKKNGFEVEHFELGGKWIESLTLPFFSIFWYLKIDIPFKKFFDDFIDMEYTEGGWYTMVIKARKVKNWDDS